MLTHTTTRNSSSINWTQTSTKSMRCMRWRKRKTMIRMRTYNGPSTFHVWNPSQRSTAHPLARARDRRPPLLCPRITIRHRQILGKISISTLMRIWNTSMRSMRLTLMRGTTTMRRGIQMRRRRLSLLEGGRLLSLVPSHSVPRRPPTRRVVLKERKRGREGDRSQSLPLSPALSPPLHVPQPIRRVRLRPKSRVQV